MVAATGDPIRQLKSEVPADLQLPDGFSNPKVAIPGVLVIRGPKFTSDQSRADLKRFTESFDAVASMNQFPLVVIVDDSDFSARTLNNWIWSTFTRSNPAVDVFGIDSHTVDKHWGCNGSVVIDARVKPGHAPPLIEDPETTAKVDARGTRGGSLARYL